MGKVDVGVRKGKSGCIFHFVIYFFSPLFYLSPFVTFMVEKNDTGEGAGTSYVWMMDETNEGGMDG